MFFYYDSDNSPVSMSYNGTMYYYLKNLQGDIVKIINKNGTVYGTYTYDSWGNIISSSGDPFVSRLNPLRYRGYVYDTDTGLYYLQSRYYDSVTGRFINADDTAYIGATGTVLSSNLFAYCENDPIRYTDKTGTVTPANVIGAVIGGIVGAIGGYVLTNWLADKLKLHGWTRNLFVWGLTAVIGAAAATIGYFVGPYVAKAWSYLSARLADLVKGSFKTIARFTAEKMRHINVDKHLWSRVLEKNVTNTNIQKLIYRTVKNESWEFNSKGVLQIL